jgi:hypothetical protein
VRESVARRSYSIASEFSREKSSGGGDQPHSNFKNGGMVKPFRGIRLTDVGNRRNGVAIVAGLVGAGATIGLLAVLSAWLLDRHALA